MKRLTVAIGAELMRDIKVKAAKEGISIREYILRLVLTDLKKEKDDTQ